jgi:hypothetical protein
MSGLRIVICLDIKTKAATIYDSLGVRAYTDWAQMFIKFLCDELNAFHTTTSWHVGQWTVRYAANAPQQTNGYVAVFCVCHVFPYQLLQTARAHASACVWIVPGTIVECTHFVLLNVFSAVFRSRKHSTIPSLLQHIVLT